MPDKDDDKEPELFKEEPELFTVEPGPKIPDEFQTHTRTAGGEYRDGPS